VSDYFVDAPRANILNFIFSLRNVNLSLSYTAYRLSCPIRYHNRNLHAAVSLPSVSTCELGQLNNERIMRL